MRKRCLRGTGPETMLNRGLISSSFDFISSTNITILFFSSFFLQIYRLLRDSIVQEGRINSRKGGREKSLEKNICESKSIDDNDVDSGRNEIERWRKKALNNSSFTPMAFLMEEMEMEKELEEEVKMKRRISGHRQSDEEQGKKKSHREEQDERGEGGRKRDYSDNFRTSFTDYPKERRERVGGEKSQMREKRETVRRKGRNEA